MTGHDGAGVTGHTGQTGGMRRRIGAGTARALRLLVLACALWPAAAPAQTQTPGAAGGVGGGQRLSALARLDPAASRVADDGAEVVLDLAISQAVPFRVFMMQDPPRLVADFREVDFGAASALNRSAQVLSLHSGAFRPGWSRLVAELAGPYRVARAWQETGAGTASAAVHIRLEPTDAAGLAAVAQEPGAVLRGTEWDLPEPVLAPTTPKLRQTGEAPLIVVLDPGHGGLDPGAQAGDLNEKDLVLSFARDLREALIRAGMRVVMTRDEDVFVPLETRISVARASRADLFLSLHADALPEGVAVGATVYTMDRAATDEGAELLAERHDRADLLAGVDLTGQDDGVAGVLMDLARIETRPRSERLARELAHALLDQGLPTHRHPVQHAAFSVLKSPDIPSALLELGFLSSPSDRARLADPAWRQRAVAAVVAGIGHWAVADAAEARLIRQ